MEYLGKAREDIALEHPELYACAQEMMCELRNLRFPHGAEQPQWMFADDFQNRAEELHDYLSAALELVKCQRFVPAYAILRSALEHAMVDLLLRAGPRHRLELDPVNEPRHHEMLQRFEKDPDSSSLLSVTPSTGDRVMAVHKGALALYYGHKYEERISIYWRLYRRHNPTVGQNYVRDGLIALRPMEYEDEEDYAHRQRKLYVNFFEFATLCAHLSENQLLTRGELPLLRAHHQYLKAFVHPSSWGARSVRGAVGKLRQKAPADQLLHVRSELVLLYIVCIVNWVLQVHLRQCHQHRYFVSTDYARSWDLSVSARRHAAHLLFPGTCPITSDDTPDAAECTLGRLGPVNYAEHPPMDASEIADSEIWFPLDQLERLEQWHHAQLQPNDGHRYVPPWLDDGALEQQTNVKVS